MRIIMMGTGPFAVPSFQALLDSDHEVVALVTRPVPPPKGRRKTAANPMRQVGTDRGITILDPGNVNEDEAIATIAGFSADLLVVCDYGQILSSKTLSAARLGGINLHGSLLPKYRGAAPINYALLCGETETGVTVIHMSPRLDAGHCLVFRTTPIEADEDAEMLERRLSALGPEAVLDAIAQLARWDGQSEIGVPQDPQLVTKAPRLKKTDGLIDWTKEAGQICNQIRAFKPWPTSYMLLDIGRKEPLRAIVDKASVVESTEPNARPGTIVQLDKNRLAIQTGKAAIAIEKIQPSGKRIMSIEEFLRGYPVQADQQIGAN